MRVVGEYIISVCGVALLCAMIAPFIKKGISAGMVKLMTGVLLLLAVLQPLFGISLPIFGDMTMDFQADAQATVNDGKEQTQQELAEIIKDRTAAYILQKADAMGLQLTVEVGVSADPIPVPETVTIIGVAAPYARQQLQDMIRRDLGIIKENQIWT